MNFDFNDTESELKKKIQALFDDTPADPFEDPSPEDMKTIRKKSLKWLKRLGDHLAADREEGGLDLVLAQDVQDARPRRVAIAVVEREGDLATDGAVRAHDARRDLVAVPEPLHPGDPPELPHRRPAPGRVPGDPQYRQRDLRGKQYGQPGLHPHPEYPHAQPAPEPGADPPATLRAGTAVSIA